MLTPLVYQHHLIIPTMQLPVHVCATTSMPDLESVSDTSEDDNDGDKGGNWDE